MLRQVAHENEVAIDAVVRPTNWDNCGRHPVRAPGRNPEIPIHGLSELRWRETLVPEGLGVRASGLHPCSTPGEAEGRLGLSLFSSGRTPRRLLGVPEDRTRQV